MSVCHIDIETYSELDLGKVGSYKYFEHPSTELLCLCYAIDDGPVNIWIPKLSYDAIVEWAHKFEEFRGGKVYFGNHYFPEDLREHVTSGKECRAHNSTFERTGLNSHVGEAIGFPKTKITQWVCTAAKAAAHSLPRNLKDACKVTRVEHQKDEEGRKAMLKLCKPKKPSAKDPSTRYLPHARPDLYITNYEYCADDVRAERDLDNFIPELSPSEQKLFFFDQQINDRGVTVDVDASIKMIELVKERKDELAKECIGLCGLKPSQTGKLTAWLKENGLPELKGLSAEVLKLVIEEQEENQTLEDDVLRVVVIRLAHSMTATAKFNVIERAACNDNKMRGMFLFHGAGTGRWSGKLVQFQNLFRPIIDDADTAIDAALAGGLDLVSMLYPQEPMSILASCIRGMIVAKPGRRFMAVDFTSVEAVALAWMAGQDDVVESFRETGMIYEINAALIYGRGVSIETLKYIKEHCKDERFIGKIATLALGYQGGYRAFISMAEKNGVKGMTKIFAEKIKTDWREANDKIVDMWDAFDNAVRTAILRKGKIFKTHGCHFMWQNGFLYIRLPSGRRLAYFNARIVGGDIIYYGVDSKTKKWGIQKLYGGKITENIIQAFCRDLLVHALWNVKRRMGEIIDIVGHVHDELLMEVLEREGLLAEVLAMVCELPHWAEGLPLKADGFIEDRFRK
jgi:DNA polymerase